MSRRPAAQRARAIGWMAVLAALAGAGCENAPTSNVDYGASTPIGAWQLSGVQVNGGAGVGVVNTAGTSAPTAGFGGGVAGTTEQTAGVGALPTGGTGGSGIAGDGSLLAGTSGGTAGVGGSTAGVGGTGTAGTGSTTGLSSLMFTVTTKSQNGRYAPKNIGAIWIENSSGQFVKTLEVWAFIRARYLSKWNGEAGANQVDAVASATLPNHKTHTVTWNMKDASGNFAAPGAYKMIIEVTDRDATGSFATVSFDTSAGATTVTAPDEQYFTGMQIVLQ